MTEREHEILERRKEAQILFLRNAKIEALKYATQEVARLGDDTILGKAQEIYEWLIKGL